MFATSLTVMADRLALSSSSIYENLPAPNSEIADVILRAAADKNPVQYFVAMDSHA
jgi:hypothetical protein